MAASRAVDNNISRRATAGTNSLRLSWHVLSGVRPLFVPRESVASILYPPSTVENQPGRRRRQLLTIAQWNVRNLPDREGADRPEWRTALVAMELVKYNIDIAALRETRLSESGSLNDLEYSLFWSGIFRPVSNKHVSTWTASVYTVQVTLLLYGSACFYTVHVVKTSMWNYFAKTRRSCFEFRVYRL